MTVAVDEAYEYTQVAGFVAEFCALGGTIVKRLWSPQGDISAYITRERANGFFVEDPANFTTEFKNLKGSLAKRVVGGGFVTDSDEAMKRLGGVVHGAPTPPSGKPTRLIRSEYLTAYDKVFPALAVGEPVIFTIGYFDAMTAVLTARRRYTATSPAASGASRRRSRRCGSIARSADPPRPQPPGDRAELPASSAERWERSDDQGHTQRRSNFRRLFPLERPAAQPHIPAVQARQPAAVSSLRLTRAAATK